MIRVGTCSWADKSTIKSGEFYPQSIKTPEQRLRYYASLFPTLEVDSTYYAISPQRNARLWNERTPSHFVFHFKAYSALTGHGADMRTLPRDIKNLLPQSEQSKRYVYIKERSIIKELAHLFNDSVKPLYEAQKLGFIVFPNIHV